MDDATPHGENTMMAVQSNCDAHLAGLIANRLHDEELVDAMADRCGIVRQLAQGLLSLDELARKTDYSIDSLLGWLRELRDEAVAELALVHAHERH